jgi:hypothetical protein
MNVLKLSGTIPQRVLVAVGLALLLSLTLAGRSTDAYRPPVPIRGSPPNAGSWVSRSAPRHEQPPPRLHVQWLHFPPQKTPSDNDWGPFLLDIDSHLPEEFGDHYSSRDLITHAHETTHGINTYLTNRYNRTGKPAYGFYVGDDRAIVLVEPKVKLSQVAALIPKSVRGSRYKLYLDEQRQYFENHPLYIFDEWTAYVNGARAGIEQARRSPTAWDRRDDAVVGALELTIYALGLARAVEEHDPGYLKKYPEFRAFLADELRRAVAVYNQGIVMEPFRWDRRLETNLVRGADTEALRDTLHGLYGNEIVLAELLSPPSDRGEPMLATSEEETEDAGGTPQRK